MTTNTEFKFTFEKESNYISARCTGYIDMFDIVRMKVAYDDGHTVDFPVYSKEEYEEYLRSMPYRDGKIVKVYQDKHYYDVADYE